jgi:hypothetical protein
MDDDDTTAMWRDYRRQRAEQRADALPARQAAIADLARHGFVIVRMTEYQFRVNGLLDLFPTRQRYHYLPKDWRGGYQDPLECCRRFLKGEGVPARGAGPDRPIG